MAVTVRERDGAWCLFMDYKGRRKARRVGAGKPGMRAAKAAAEKIQATLAFGDTALLDETREMARTFTEFAEGWLKYVAAQRKPGTSEKYEMILREPSRTPRQVRHALRGEPGDRNVHGSRINSAC